MVRREIDGKFVDQLHHYLDSLDSQLARPKSRARPNAGFYDIAKSGVPSTH
jgi:hypothetical protein